MVAKHREFDIVGIGLGSSVTKLDPDQPDWSMLLRLE